MPPQRDDQTPIHRLVARARAHPDQVAVRYWANEGSWETLTYRGLAARAAALAEPIRHAPRGEAGHRFALIALPSQADYVAAFYACHLAGATAITFYAPALLTARAAAAFAERLGHILRDCDPGAVICHEDLLPLLDGALGPGWRDRRVVVMPERVPATTELPDAPPASPADLALLQYTSGSTSQPKGVMVSHGNLAHNVQTITAALSSAEGETICGWLPLYHDMGLIGLVCHPLWAGMSAHLLPPAAFVRRPQRWLTALSEARAAITIAPNFGYDLIARRTREEHLHGIDLSGLRHAINGAEPVRASTLEALHKRFAACGLDRTAVMPVFGLAEGTLAVTLFRRRQEPVVVRLHPDRLNRDGIAETTHETRAIESVACGTDEPLDGIETLIVDPTSHTACPPGTVGEIWVSGPSVAQGYWGQPGLTAKTFQARVEGRGDTPRLRTGDLGVFLDGSLFIVGRVKDIIVHHGANHYPQDLEYTAEASHPALRAGGAAAFAVHEDDRERVVVLAELDRFGPEVDRGQVISAMRRAVAEVHGLSPDVVALVGRGAVPKTTSGKVRRRTAAARWLHGDLSAIAAWTAVPRPEGENA